MRTRPRPGREFVDTVRRVSRCTRRAPDGSVAKRKVFFHVASRLAFVPARAFFPRLPVASYDFLTGYANRGTSLRFAGTDAVARPGPPP